MAEISKHYSKQEWESDASKDSRIYLFIGRYPISVDNLLERVSELISLKVGRRNQLLIRNLL